MAKSNEIVPAVPNLAGLDIPDDLMAQASGIESYRDTRLIDIPYLKFKNSDTKEHRSGDFIFPDGSIVHGGLGQTIEIAILQVQRPRVMFPEYDAKNAEGNSPICRSFDGEMGDPNMTYAGQNCKTCQFSKWGKNKEKPACSEQRRILIRRLNGDGTEEYYYVSMKGSNISPFDNFIKEELKKYAPKLPNGEPFSLAVKVKMKMDRVEAEAYNKMVPIISFEIDPKDPYLTEQQRQETSDYFVTYLKNINEMKKERRLHLMPQADLGLITGADAF